VQPEVLTVGRRSVGSRVLLMPDRDVDGSRLFVRDVMLLLGGMAMLVLFAVLVALFSFLPCTGLKRGISQWPVSLRQCADQHQAKYSISADGQSLIPLRDCDDLIFITACT
jgi:hypothetical protein